MAHPSEGVLQAFIDGELAADERARVAAHLEQCAACRAELDALQAAAAAFTAAVIGTRGTTDLARARETVLRGADRARRPVLNLLPRRPRRFVAARGALLRAAVLVLVVAGAASAAVPGSPVRRLLVNLWQQTTKLFVSHPAAPVAPVAQPPAPTPAPPLAFPVGVSVRPLDGRIQVLLDTPAPGLRVHVRLVDGELASVQASGPASSARFSTGPGRIEVVGGGPGDLLIDLPRTTDAAQVRADDQLLFSKIGARVRHAPVVDSTDEGMLFRLLP